MEGPPEDAPLLLLLHGSWVEVAPEAEQDPRQDREGAPDGAAAAELEAILREAQMEAPERGDGAAPAPKGPPAEDGSVAGQMEDAEMPPLSWPWPGPAEPLPATDLARLAPPLLSPALHRKRALRDPQLALLLVPSLLLSHVLALGLGICIGKRLAASSSSAL